MTGALGAVKNRAPKAAPNHSTGAPECGDPHGFLAIAFKAECMGGQYRKRSVGIRDTQGCAGDRINKRVRDECGKHRTCKRYRSEERQERYLHA